MYTVIYTVGNKKRFTVGNYWPFVLHFCTAMPRSFECGMICILALLYPLVTAIKPSDVKMAMANAQGYFLLLSWSSVLTLLCTCTFVMR